MPNRNAAETFIAGLPDDRREPVEKLRDTINDNLPEGFEEAFSGGMISWVVPHKTYPAGYHCDPKQPLPFISLALQKSHIALYHMGVYADLELLDWFNNEWPKYSKKKLDMGKSCIRFKKPDDVPFELIGKLAARTSPQDWIKLYERTVKR